MQKIHKLSEQIISKIAAGEVIERPAYAIKELIENAVDAKADFVKIEIEQGGLKSIVVSDNGEGMSITDIQECFKPHATSKIFAEEDLNRIKTLGFRGEALSSIAAISNLVIKSKTNIDTAGTVVELKAGSLENIAPVGMPSGTSIIVDHLFYTVPARRKFLKSLKTETKYIIDIVVHFALSYPNIRFLLANNGKTIFDLPKNQSSTERIKMLLGSAIFNNLIPVNYEDSYINLSGFISKPQLASSTQNKNFIFVNNRCITDKLISLAVKEAYGNLLDSTSYPVFILFLTVPYEAVDVNVHPRKEQVGFIDSKLIFDTVSRAVTDTLNKNNLTFYSLSWANQNKYSHKKGETKSYAGQILKEIVMEDIGKISKNSDIIQAHNVCLITQTRNGIIIIDQHAAHERILYERFLDAFKKQRKKKDIFTLSKALPLDLSIQDTELLVTHLSTFKKLGFDIEHFQSNTFKVNAVPLLFKDRDCRELISEILEDLSLNKNPKLIDKQSNKMLEYLACRAAIKAGDKLNKKECKALIEELEATKSNYTCPHGRPIKVEISLQELYRMFKRS